jgi:hypothetical protein
VSNLAPIEPLAEGVDLKQHIFLLPPGASVFLVGRFSRTVCDEELETLRESLQTTAKKLGPHVATMLVPDDMEIVPFVATPTVPDDAPAEGTTP